TAAEFPAVPSYQQQRLARHIERHFRQDRLENREQRLAERTKMADQEPAIRHVAAADGLNGSAVPYNRDIAWDGQPLKGNAAAERIKLPAPLPGRGRKPDTGGCT